MHCTCIYCSADLKSNDALERFPVGRSIAFDGEKGRLWAVCPGCARWNLAPIEERWEAVEDAERLFRESRIRAQSENIGLAKLRDGTRLVRVGKAVGAEMWAWRFGADLRRRRTRYMMAGAASYAAMYAASSAAVASGIGVVVYAGYILTSGIAVRLRRRRIVYRSHAEDGCRGPVAVRRQDLYAARLGAGDAGLELRFPRIGTRRGPGSVDGLFARPLVLRGDAARVVLGRAMIDVNRGGAAPAELNAALAAVRSAGSPEALLLEAGRQGLLVTGARGPAALCNPLRSLALEVALHEETERRALEGDLAALEAMWREAEAIAAIADHLPDVPPPEPPRVDAG